MSEEFAGNPECKHMDTRNPEPGVIVLSRPLVSQHPTQLATRSFALCPVYMINMPVRTTISVMLAYVEIHLPI